MAQGTVTARPTKYDFIWDSHEASWSEKIQDLLKFIEEHGHAHVPSSYPKSPQLATWVKVSQPLAWYIHVSPIHSQNSMEEHDKLTYGIIPYRRSSSCHFSVPTSTVWYKLKKAEKSTNMSAERIAQLEALDFVWEVRHGRPKKPRANKK